MPKKLRHRPASQVSRLYVVVTRSISASLVFLSVFGKTKLLCDRLIIGEEKVVIVFPFARIVYNTRIVQRLEEFGLRPESVRHFSQAGRLVTDTDGLVPDGQFIAHRRPRIFNVCHSKVLDQCWRQWGPPFQADTIAANLIIAK